MPKEANRRLAHLDPFFGGRRLNTITGADVTAYVAMRQGAGAANGTIQRRLGTVIPALFPHLTGVPAGRRIRDFRKAWITACEAVRVAGRTRHDLRRTAVPQPRAEWRAARVGHRTENVYRRYAIVSDAGLQVATRRLVGTDPGTSEGVGSGSARGARSELGD